MRARLIASALVTMLLSGAMIIFFPSAPTTYAQGANCDSSYPGECVPPYPPDLNCGDVSDKRFGVLPPDPHGFDNDGDGVGCES
jgi:micrococcal nuclease